MDYSKRICKGLCQQADDIGLCMGICSTSPDYAQQCYDHYKKQAVAQGKPWEPIPDFEPAPKPEEPKVVNVQNSRAFKR